MSVNFPSSLDNFANPISTDLLDNASATLDHWTQHSDANDAIEALEAKVGADGSAVTTSFDYKLSEVTSTDKAVGKTATQTVTNKTLGSGTKVTIGSDAAGDTYYRASDGTLTRIPIGSNTYVLTSDGSTPSWQANAAGSDASTTVKGVVELATYAETIARTTIGGTGAKLVPTPDTLTTVLTYDYQTDSVGTDAYAITCTPAPTAYTTGMRFTFKAGTANTGICSLNVNGLGAKTIKKSVSSDLNTGDILANQIVEVVYDGTNFQLVSIKAQATTYTNGTTTKTVNDASATQTIAHGLGIAPKFVRITAMVNTSNTNGNGLQFIQCQTVYNGTTQSSLSIVSTSSTSSTVSTNFVLGSGTTGNSDNSTGVITVDATNISIAWTKNGSPGATIYTLLWEAQA